MSNQHNTEEHQHNDFVQGSYYDAIVAIGATAEVSGLGCEFRHAVINAAIVALAGSHEENDEVLINLVREGLRRYREQAAATREMEEQVRAAMGVGPTMQ